MIRRDHSHAAKAEDQVAKRRGSGNTGRMVHTLDHLPAGKRAELAFVVDVLRTSFDEERQTIRLPSQTEHWSLYALPSRSVLPRRSALPPGA